MSSLPKMTIKSKSSSLKYTNGNITTLERNMSSYTDDGYVTQNNDSNHNMTRKSSIKHKFISLFKSHSRINRGNYCNSVDNNARNSLARDSSQVDSSRSTLSNNTGLIVQNTTINSYSLQLNEPKSRLDQRDKQLIEQFSLHPFIGQIIECITEQNCSTIKLPSSWIASMGNELSNKVLQPFLNSIPGQIGVKNHGNTCYVNVIIQCLAHIDSVAQYFSTKDYLTDIRQCPSSNTETPSASSATSLDVLVSLSYLLQSLWQHTYQSKISMKFCQMLTLHKTQFSIDSQQDAHELLLCLLNLLHDNLVRPTIPEPSNPQTKEETSFIYDRFRGWLSNEITCPKCGYSRKHRDQMLSLNLQIPKYQRNTANNRLFAIVVIDGNQIGQKHAFEINDSTTVANIRASIADRLRCLSSDIIVLEMVESGFGKLYSDDELLMNISQKCNFLPPITNDNFENGLCAVYIPNQVVDVDSLPTEPGSEDETNQSVKWQKELWDTQPFIRLLVVHVEKNKYSAQEYISEINDELRRSLKIDTESGSSTTLNSNLSFNQKHFLRFTNVLTVQAARKTKLGLLRYSLCEQMIKYLNLRNIKELPKPQFLIEGSHLISEQDNYPLCHPSVTDALRYSAEICGIESAVVRLVVVWPFHTTQMLRFSRRTVRNSSHEGLFLPMTSKKVSLHSSVEELCTKYNTVSVESSANKKEIEPQITINDCLREFFSLDSVSVTESWNCQSCQTMQQAHTNIRIKQAPEILILMLKRFSNGQTTSDQYPNTSMKKDPSRSESLRRTNAGNQLNGTIRRDTLMRKNTVNRREDNLNKLECLVDYPLENLDIKDYMENNKDDESYLYNLAGVVNHRGNLSNGHYVAMCKNSIDDRWRIYDDDRVKEISKSDVVHPDAYILFYKRQLKQSDNIPDLHWSYRRLAFPDKIHRNQSPNPTTPYLKHRRFSERDLDHGATTRSHYATLPLAVSNNHNSTNSLHDRLSSIHESPHIDSTVLSPHLSSSSSTSLSNCVTRSSSSLHDNDPSEFIDIATIVSSIVDLASYSTQSSNVCSLERFGSNESDSGTALTPVSTCPRHLPGSNPGADSCGSTVEYIDRDECYCSLSTSPSMSSRRTSKKLTSLNHSNDPVQ